MEKINSREEKWKKKLMLPSFVVLLQFAVVSVVIVLHPLLDLRVTLPVKMRKIRPVKTYDELGHASISTASPATKADFISTQVKVIIRKYLRQLIK